MMRLKVKPLGEGLHPSEIFVSVETKDGPQDLVVHPSSVHRNTLNIGWPVGRKGRYLLVELPRQTSIGAWRVWVSKDELIQEKTTRPSAWRLDKDAIDLGEGKRMLVKGGKLNNPYQITVPENLDAVR